MTRGLNTTLARISGAALLALALGTPLSAQADIDVGEGAAVYQAQCAACHQATGAGIPAAFPPLAGNAPELVNAEGGRDYLINVVLYGLSGAITVQGQTYQGMMPPMAHLGDEQIADVLNFILTAWDNAELLDEEFEAIDPEEVAERRGETLTPIDVLAQREALELE